MLSTRLKLNIEQTLAACRSRLYARRLFNCSTICIMRAPGMALTPPPDRRPLLPASTKPSPLRAPARGHLRQCRSEIAEFPPPRLAALRRRRAEHRPCDLT